MLYDWHCPPGQWQPECHLLPQVFWPTKTSEEVLWSHILLTTSRSPPTQGSDSEILMIPILWSAP